MLNAATQHLQHARHVDGWHLAALCLCACTALTLERGGSTACCAALLWLLGVEALAGAFLQQCAIQLFSLFGEMWPIVLVVDPCALDLFCARGSVHRSAAICVNGLSISPRILLELHEAGVAFQKVNSRVRHFGMVFTFMVMKRCSL